MRELFVRQHGLHLILYIAKHYTEVCKAEVSSFLGTLEDQDWEMFRNTDKPGNCDDDNWQRKYRGNSILREKNSHPRERKSIDLQQASSLVECLKVDLHP